MSIHIAYLLAVLSTTAVMALWFWVARKELFMKQTLIKSLIVFVNKHAKMLRRNRFLELYKT